MKLKVQKIGNSLGVVLPKEVVSRLKADEGDRLFLIEGPEGTYQLTACDPGFEKKMEKAEDMFCVTARHCTCWRSDGNGVNKAERLSLRGV